MRENVLHLVYVSSAAGAMSTADLEEILSRARERNRRLGVTGMLVYCDGNIMQALEGPNEVVSSLFDKIAADPRHRGVTEVLRYEGPERDFPDWSMAFADTDSQSQFRSCLDLMRDEAEIMDRLNPDRPIRRLLLGFVDGNARPAWR